MMLNIIGIIVAKVIILLVIIAISWSNAKTIRRLSDDGWVFYYSKTCTKCAMMRRQIGRMKLMWIKTINIDSNAELAKSKHLRSHHTWLNEKTNKWYEGGDWIGWEKDADIILASKLSAAPLRSIPTGIKI